MRYTYKYEIYHQKNTILLGNLLDDLHEVHKHFLTLCKRYYRIYKKYPGKYSLTRHLTKLKKLSKYKHWNQLPSQALQDLIFRIDRGYQQFFKYLKNKKKGIQGLQKVSPPKYKKKHKYWSLTLSYPAGYKIEDNRIYIGCLKKWFTFWKSRSYNGNIKTITIKRDKVGDYYLCIVTDKGPDTEFLAMTDRSVGLDFGMKTFLTTSDGYGIESPQFFKQAEKEIRKANRSLSKKQKKTKDKRASNNYYRALRHLQRVHKKVANKREDWFWKLAKRLVTKYDIIGIEDLNIEGMKRLWGKKISDLAFSTFATILEWMCNKYGKKLIKIGRWTPTSKPCNSCGYLNKDLKISDRSWTCPECNLTHDRDINAAININNESLKLLHA